MMELFPESEYRTEISTKNEEIYMNLLSNQVSSPPDEAKLGSDIEEKSNKNAFEHRLEATKGNFMPSIVLLDEKKIDVNEPIDEKEDTLLHLACKFADINAVKTLIEEFEADLNAKNTLEKTPFYILCKNKNKHDPFLFSYFIQRRKLNIDCEDSRGITPLICSIKSQNLNVFYTLISLGCDVKHKDKENRDIYYYAIKYDNLPVLKYLLKHSGIGLLSSINNLTPILITSKGSKCCKYLFKYHYKKVIKGISEPLNKTNYPENKFNLFNYELIMTCYKQSKMSYLKNFFNILTKGFTYKIYNICFISKFLIKKYLNETKRRRLSIVYILCLLSLQIIFYSLTRYTLKGFLYKTLNDAFQVFTSFLAVFFTFRLFVNYKPENINGFYHKAFDPTYEKKSESILGVCENAYLNRIYEMPSSGEDCPICLVQKNKNIQHCNVCNKCVIDFYFHSFYYGICINRDNAIIYSMLNLLLMIKQISLLCIFGNNIRLFYGFFTIFYSFCAILIYGNIIYKIFGLYLFISSFAILGKVLSVLICVGTNSSYYLIYRSHDISYGKLVPRKIYDVVIDYLVPITNLFNIKDFFSNILTRKQLENVE